MDQFDGLETFLKSRISGLSGRMLLEAVAGGQSNPTFFVTFDNRRLVLRKRPAGTLLPSAHAVDREFRVMDALGRVGIPVPRVILYHPDDDVVGTAFYVMERVDGRIFHDSQLAAAPKADRMDMYRSAAHTLAAIHRVDFDSAGLTSFGKQGNFFTRQIARWTRQWQMSKTRDLPEIERLAQWLPANMPRDDQTTVVHGDFRIGNLIFHETEPRVIAVLDWELSTLGHPLADLAHSCIYGWHVTPQEYGGLLGLDLEHCGLPTQDQFADAYYACADQTERLSTFHIVLALFRNAVIFEGIASRAKAGNASASNAADVGQLATVFARRALALTEG